MEEGGWLWSESFGDTAAEYAAVRDGVGMWDVSPLNKWEFRGPDAVEAAQRVHSNDILGLEVGTGPVRRVPGRGRVARRRRHGVQARRRSPVGHDERHGARRVLRGGDQGTRRLGRLHRARAAEHADPGAAIAGAAADAHRRAISMRSATSTSSPTRSRSAACRCGCRGRGSAASSASSCSCGPSTRPICGRRWRARAPPVRGRGDRTAAHRDRHGRHRLRLRGARTVAVRPGHGPPGRAGHGRGVHGEGAAARDRGRPAEPFQDAAGGG